MRLVELLVWCPRDPPKQHSATICDMAQRRCQWCSWIRNIFSSSADHLVVYPPILLSFPFLSLAGDAVR